MTTWVIQWLPVILRIWAWTTVLFSFATTSSALATLLIAKARPNEIVYFETGLFSIFIFNDYICFASKATLTPIAMIAPWPSITRPSNGIIPDTQRTNRRASRLAARLFDAAIGRYVTNISSMMTRCSFVSMKYSWANGHGP